ncbi:MAG: RIP metalloprotease RseP [Lachnospiraceae bacterium]|nr:RIP metalloprotease RseP [Lachnospiraceae bacterium]
MSIIIGIIILGVVVFIHELGHFIFAKANGIVVEEFSLGMGPTFFSFTKGETKYSLKIFPIGGSCAMKGEDEDDFSEGSFQSAKIWQRMLVIIGGPAFNIILGFAVALIVIGVMGADPARVAEVKENSPAYEAGLRVGDEIVKFNGSTVANAREVFANTNLYGIPTDEITLTVTRDGEKIDISYEPVVTTSYKVGFYYNPDDQPAYITGIIKGGAMEAAGFKEGDLITAIDGHKVSTGMDLNAYLAKNPMDGSPVTIDYRRSGVPYSAVLTPALDESSDGGFSYSMEREKQGISGVVKYAFGETGYLIRITAKSLAGIVTGRFTVRDMAGPIGVVSTIGDVYNEVRAEGTASDLIMNMLSLMILISVNLGVLNLIPFPALDGFRFLLLIIEAIRRKPISQKVEGNINLVGFVLLMAFAVFIAVNDVLRLVG